MAWTELSATRRAHSSQTPSLLSRNCISYWSRSERWIPAQRQLRFARTSVECCVSRVHGFNSLRHTCTRRTEWNRMELSLRPRTQSVTLATRTSLGGILTPSPSCFLTTFFYLSQWHFALPHMHSSTQTSSSAHVYHDHTIKGKFIASASVLFVI